MVIKRHQGAQLEKGRVIHHVRSRIEQQLKFEGSSSRRRGTSGRVQGAAECRCVQASSIGSPCPSCMLAIAARDMPEKRQQGQRKQSAVLTPHLWRSSSYRWQAKSACRPSSRLIISLEKVRPGGRQAAVRSEREERVGPSTSQSG